MNPINRLVKKAQKGNDKAFLKLFQKYEKDLYRMAFVYVKNNEDALDVVQEVAYQSFKKVSTLGDPGQFKTWLLSITVHCAIDLIRKNRKVVQLKDSFAEIIYQENINDSIPLTLTLQDLMNSLREEEKSIVMLKFYNDLTFQEISKLLNIPIGTVKSILYRALGKLKGEYLKGDGVNE